MGNKFTRWFNSDSVQTFIKNIAILIAILIISYLTNLGDLAVPLAVLVM